MSKTRLKPPLEEESDQPLKAQRFPVRVRYAPISAKPQQLDEFL